MAYDDVFNVIGKCGRYQIFIYILQTLPVMFTAIQTYLPVFILYAPDHRCASPSINATKLKMEGVNLDHNTLNSIKLYSKCEIFTNESLHQLMDPMSENTYPHNYYTNNILHKKYISLERSADGNFYMHSSECEHWEFDTSEFKTTFVTEDNLVCGKKFHRAHAIFAFMAGFTAGSFLIGVISDKFGRKAALMGSILLYIGSNLPLSFINAYWIFTMLRAFSGVSVGGILNVCYVMDLELVGPRKRMLAGMVLMLFWGIGALLLTGMAYLFRNWRDLNLYLALPTILFLFYGFLLEESPRWLIVNGQRRKAEAILRKIARLNGKNVEEPILADDDRAVPAVQRWTVKELCSQRQLVFQTFVILLNWFVVALVFLGLSWNVNYLEGDVFFNFFLASIAEVIGFLSCIPLLNRIGRKPVYVFSLFMGGIALLLTMIPVLLDSSDMNWVMFLLSFMGKVGSSAAFATIFLYSAEFFPTVIRNTGLGIANVCARSGGMVAPYIPIWSEEVSGEVGKVLTMGIFGVLAILAGSLSILLPETNKRRLPETFEDFNRLNRPEDPGEEFDVPPPSNGHIIKDEDMDIMQPQNGRVEQNESDMLQPLNEHAENNGDVNI